MHNRTNLDIDYSDEDISDKDETGIITNNDEFCTINELQSNPPNNSKTNKISQLQHHRAVSKKIGEPFKISSPMQVMNTPHMNLFSLLLNNDNNNDKYKKVSKKKMKMKKKFGKKNYLSNNSNVKKFLDESKNNGKSVFLKISEDIYSKLKSKPNKEVRDIYKTEEDAYNKMTSDPYIRTCKNKENVKNKKIVQQCLDRKAKEDIFKKIGIECDRNREKKKLQDPKRACSVTDRNINFKSTRTLAQFLRDQKGERKKEKKINKNNKKIPMPFKENILPQDSTFVFSEDKEELKSQFSDFSKNYLDECKSMIANSDKYIINVEEEKGTLNNKNNNKINKTFQMNKESINSNNFSLLSVNSGNKYKNGKNKINKNEKTNNKSQKKSLNIKENSTASISKNSAETNIIKFLNLYKETIEIIYGQKIENDFEINFSFFLLILYKIGFTNKNYSSLIEMSYETDTKKMETMHPSVISDISLSNSSSANISINRNNPIKKRNVINNLNNSELKNKNSIAGKSLEDEAENYTINSFKNDKEFILCKDAWKILTEKKNFDEDICITNKKFFLFFICVLGIGEYLREKKNFKKDYNFFFNDKKIMNQYNNLKKYINKYFGIFSINANENSINSEKKYLIVKNNTNSYNNSIATSFVVNNSDINNKYNIYEKNYFNGNRNLDNLEDTNSEKLFYEGIKEEEKFFYSVNNQSEKSYKTLNFTEMGDLTNNNNNNNLLNSSLTDNSSILDLKKFLNPNTSEKMDDEIEVDSFLFEDNKKNYFKYNNNEINNDSSIEPPKTKKINNNNINNNTKKRVGYVFEIKVENELKKLVLKKGEDKNIIVKNFCEKYGINEEEKTKIIKIIDERLKNYSASQNLL